MNVARTTGLAIGMFAKADEELADVLSYSTRPGTFFSDEPPPTLRIDSGFRGKRSNRARPVNYGVEPLACFRHGRSSNLIQRCRPNLLLRFNQIACRHADRKHRQRLTP